MLRQITIEAAANGWVVQVGCQRFVFESLSGMLREIERYLTNPEQAEKEAYQRFPNMRFTHPMPQPATPTPMAETAGDAAVIPGEVQRLMRLREAEERATIRANRPVDIGSPVR